MKGVFILVALLLCGCGSMTTEQSSSRAPSSQTAHIVSALGIPADPGYDSNIGVTHDTVHEAADDVVNGRVYDARGQRNTTMGMIMSERRHALGQFQYDDR